MLALVIFLVTLLFVIWQPKGIGIGWSALAGAAVALVTGVIHPGDIPTVWHIVWDATFTFVALIIIRCCSMRRASSIGRLCMSLAGAKAASSG